ncbi:large ribosomal subunit protein eL8-like [Clinocottus analis]|uniref:large ribosomal subunit protein eL8-like n=1 Tax=Clinocottus analis TaxID=304258 RepID=UPI0035C0C507
MASSQRQRSILYKRLKVLPASNQFTQALDRQTAVQAGPQVPAGEAEAAGKADTPTKRPPVLRAGVNKQGSPAGHHCP